MYSPFIRYIASTPMIAAFLLTGLFATVLHAQPGRFARGEMDLGKPIETESGFLFVNGVYLQPPYRIEANFEKDLVHINGTEYSADAFDLSGYANRGPGMRGGGGPRGMGIRGGRWVGGDESAAPPSISLLSAVFRDFESLRIGAIVILQKSRQPIVLWPNQHGHDLLESLIATQSKSQGTIEIPAAVTSSIEIQAWQQLVAQFQTTPEFLERATAQVEKVNALEQSLEDQSAARELSSRISYPLTMFALVLVVGAAGHLLINAQPMFANSDDPETLKNIKKASVVCLVLVGLMSAIDLFWTLITNQNGTMRELNPFGSRLISDPSQLMTFKIIVTTISIGLLFWYRDLSFARRATWWCCLVLTLLIARWLTFHSLFV